MRLSDPIVNVYTRDVDAALGFYAGLLGFPETFRTPQEGPPEHVELRVDGLTLALSTVEAAARVHGVDAVAGSPSFQLVFWTDDVDAAYEELVAAGVPGLSAPHDTGNDNRNAVVCDPDGNLVELVTKLSASL